jgi:Tfp pilus assembly protein PilN
MRGDSRDKQPVFPTGMEKHSGPLGMVTIPLLHSLSGSAGAADELLIALVGGLVLVLVLSLVLGGNKGRRQDKDEQPDNEGL